MLVIVTNWLSVGANIVRHCYQLYIKSNYYLLPITYYLKIETPHSLRESSPTSGAGLVAISCWFNYIPSLIGKVATVG